MRPKKNRETRLEKVRMLFAVTDGEKADIEKSFGSKRELYVELGCGKGAFIVGMSEKYPNASLLAIERVTDVLLMAMEKADRNVCRNIRFLNADVGNISGILEPASVSRLYLNFSDPWPKKRNEKRRLTSPLFLEQYKRILLPGGRIFFKTDNRPLFDYSLESFSGNGFAVENITYDLHNEPNVSENIMTEYEKNFSNKGFPINYLEAFLK